VLLLAIALVAATQVVTLFPVLDAVKGATDVQARRMLAMAGTLLNDNLQGRAAAIAPAVNALTQDYGFKSVVASGDAPTIRSMLGNHSARVEATAALLVDPEGNVNVTHGVRAGAAIAAREPLERPGRHIVYVDDAPYQMISAPVSAPLPIGWLLMGSPIDFTLADELSAVTGFAVSFVAFGPREATVHASTLAHDVQADALTGLDADVRAVQQTAGGTSGYFATVAPVLPGGDIYVALHMPGDEAAAAYRAIRNVFLAITGASLALAIMGSVWLANTVTRPVQTLVAAARRMREGDYDEALEVRSSDELGELAASFNVMQAAIAERERRIFHQAHHDSLSGLPGRELVVSQLRDVLAEHGIVSVVSLGLDRFGGIVSSLGHRAGDDLVKLVAGALRNRLRDGEVLGHLSGHEFVVALPDVGAEDAALWVVYQADFLRAGVRLGGANISLQATGGIACYPDHSTDAAELCRRASSARTDALARHETVGLYRSGQEDHSLKQIKIVGDFGQALKNDDLRLYFQPTLDCATGDVYGVEALVRWQHTELGLLRPDAFVGAIEQAGGIAHLTRWVLRRAVQRASAWRKQGIRLAVAVNISVDDLVDEYLPYFLLDLVKQNGLTPLDLTLEVTESAIMHNVHKSLAVVTCIHELGFRIAVDDFGTGQSALAQLKRLPLDELKIDKSFVMSGSDPRDRAILKSTVDLAHQLGLAVVAEGVEDEAALERVAELGCEYAQGYGIGRPMPEADVAAWLAAWRTQRAPGVAPLAAAGRPNG
jgi:diguanylate cyclase (GGDEF)-like protein